MAKSKRIFIVADIKHKAIKTFVDKMFKMVSFGFGGCNIDTRTFLRDFYYLFKKFGFLIFRITPSGYFFPLDAYSEKLEQFRTTNFIAIRKDRG